MILYLLSMIFAAEINNLIPVFIIIGATLAAVAILLILFVFKPLKYKKMAAKVDATFQFCHALLIGQDAQNVKRLEIISHTNLLYVDIHTNFERKLKTIRDKNDFDCNKVVNEMKDYLDDKNYKEFKETYLRASDLVKQYKTTIEDFTNELRNVIKPEEESRQLALESKTKYRSIKQEYFSKETQLKIVGQSFDEIFKYVDSLFNKFEEFIESANYDEANGILPEINNVLSETEYCLRQLPELCALINNVVPEKISETKHAYDWMIENRYPVHNLFVKQTIDQMNTKLQEFNERLKSFDIADMDKELVEMQEKLANFNTQFEKEKEAKRVFDEKNENVYRIANESENRFIQLRSIIPDLSEIYVVDEEHNNQINELQKSVNKADSLRRTLDTYIHSVTRQPYSLIVEKLAEIESLVEVINSKLDEFDSYVESLKVDAETAYSLVFSVNDKIKKGEELIRLINIENIKNKYNEKIELSYDLLNKINNILIERPIDIAKVNEHVRKLSDLTNNLLDDGDISRDYNKMLLAESAIMYGNKHRSESTEVSQFLSQAEIFFENGDFEKANDTAKLAISLIKDSNGR